MTTLNLILLTLNFGVLLLNTRGIYDHLKRTKEKGRDVPPSQPFKH